MPQTSLGLRGREVVAQRRLGFERGGRAVPAAGRVLPEIATQGSALRGGSSDEGFGPNFRSTVNGPRPTPQAVRAHTIPPWPRSCYCVPARGASATDAAGSSRDRSLRDRGPCLRNSVLPEIKEPHRGWRPRHARRRPQPVASRRPCRPRLLPGGRRAAAIFQRPDGPGGLGDVRVSRPLLFRSACSRPSAPRPPPSSKRWPPTTAPRCSKTSQAMRPNACSPCSRPANATSRNRSCYAPESVGRLMTPDYIAVKRAWTLKHVLDYVRTHGRTARR